MYKRIIIGLAGVVLSFTLHAAPAESARPQTEVASTQVTGTMLVVSPKIAYTSATLRVAGPEGYEAIAWSQGGDVALDLLADGAIAASDRRRADTPDALPHGRYGYEVVLHQADGGQSVHTGAFVVEGGVPGERSGEQRGVTNQSERPGWDGKHSAVKSADGPSAEADASDDSHQVVDAEANNETFYALQNGTWAGSDDWGITNKDGDLRFERYDGIGSVGQFRMTIKENGNVGIGTSQPQMALHIFRPTPWIRLADSDPCPNPNGTWVIGPIPGELHFSVGAGCAGDAVGNKMKLTAGGRLEINTETPTLRFVDTNAGPTRAQLRLNTNRLLFEGNTDQDVASFSIQAPAGSLWLTSAGSLGVGTVTPTAKLHVAGSGRIDGDVALGSSRTLKTAFDAVDPAEVLARVADLPVASWRYRSEEESKRHIGPFAEDFQRLFGLGDGETISVIDAQGVTLAAIQGLDERLNQELTALRVANAALDAENQALSERLVRIEQLLRELSEAEGRD